MLGLGFFGAIGWGKLTERNIFWSFRPMQEAEMHTESKMWLTVLAVILMVGTLFAGTDVTGPDTSTLSQTPKKSVSEFLKPDGRFDLEAVRASGFQESLDLEGFDVRLDAARGEPIVRPSVRKSPKDDPDDIYWDNSISPSTDGVIGNQIHSVAVYEGKLIAAGSFSVAGSVLAYNIAAWDGTSWSALGSGMSNKVRAITIYNNKLIAGGDFTTAGGVTASRIAAWDGSNWSPLGSGMNDQGVYALTAYGGKLIAGGHFTTAGGVAANRIASWDGSNWSPLGLGMSWEVYALTVYDGKLMAGGDFTTAGGVTVNGIASWNGSSWSPWGSGWGGTYPSRPVVYALIVYDGKLIAGGGFTKAGGVAVNRIASWNGSSWSPLGPGMSGFVYALTVYGGKLVAGGGIIAAWDGSSWSPLGSGMDRYVKSLTVYGGKLVAGGEFTTAGGVKASRIAAWDGSYWSALGSGSGLDNEVWALAVYDNKLIVGGWFIMAGGLLANHIAAWDGSSWSPLGSGMSGQVEELTVYDNKLIAGGYFTTAGGVTVNFIAAWDGTSWSPLGSGMNGPIRALTVYSNKLIAGGYFTTAGGVTVNDIAAWDGSSWSALGSGMSGEVEVYALTVYDNKLIAGGEFTSAGGATANYIAAWDGTSWSALGSGMDNDVWALAVYNDKLIAGGVFSVAGGVTASRIAAWDGSSWSAIGSGMNDDVYALIAYDNTLIAAGLFTTAGSVSANHIAAWDGSSWSALGSGLNGGVDPGGLTIFDGALVAGGYFTSAGNKVAAFVARWTKGGNQPDTTAKQAIIDYFGGEQFYQTAEPQAQVFLNDIVVKINAGTVTSKELEALTRLLLTEEAAGSAYLSSTDIGALPIANITGKCEGSAASAVLLEVLFAKFRDAVKILKGVPILGGIYDAADGALKWINQQVLSMNRSLVMNVANRLTPGLMSTYGWTRGQAQSKAMEFGWGFVKKAEDKIRPTPLQDVSQSFIEQVLSGVNLKVYETGIPICPGCSPALYAGGTEQTLVASVGEAENLSFLEGNLVEVKTDVREVQIPEIINSNSDCLSAINTTVTAADLIGQTQFWVTVIVFILAILAVIGGLIGCPASGGIGCILAAIGGLVSWSTYTAIQTALTGVQVVAFLMGAGLGSVQLFGTLPNHLIDVRETAFQGGAQKLFVTNFDPTGERFRLSSIPDGWADSLATASDSVAEQLGLVRSLVAAGDWDQAVSALRRIDGLMDNLLRTESVSSSYLDYAYAWNESDSMANTDSIYYHTRAHNVEAEFSLALTRFATASAVINQPSGAQRDSVLMIIDNCLGSLQSLGPAYEQAYYDFNMQGFVVPPVVSVVNYMVVDTDSGTTVEVRTKNISEVSVHGVHARLSVLDSAAIPVTPISDTAYDAVAPYEENVFKWRLQKSVQDTLIRLEFEIEPDTVQGDFLGDTRLIAIHSNQSTIQYLCGDANWSGSVNISDAVYLIAYIFSGGPAPSPLLAGDANCSGTVNISDAVYLIAYIFSGGPAPCAGCK